MAEGDHDSAPDCAPGGRDTQLSIDRRRPRDGLARRSIFVGAVVLLVLTGTAVGAGGLSVGTILPGDETPGPPGYRQTDETVVALGSDPRVGNWRIVTYASPELVDRGEVLQPEGLPCLKLALSDAALGHLIAGRSYCGEHGNGGLAAATLPVQTPNGRVLTFLFGQAPEKAAAVKVASSAGWARGVQLHEGPATVEGDFWLDVMPHGTSAAETWVEWAGSDGSRVGERVDLTLELRRPMTPVEIGPASGG
jgi:hypothetical protein